MKITQLGESRFVWYVLDKRGHVAESGIAYSEQAARLAAQRAKECASW